MTAGTTDEYRTIYPYTDIDYIHLNSGTYTQLKVTISPAGTANDIETHYELYDNAGTWLNGTFVGDGTEVTLYSLTTFTDYYLRVRRADNLLTGTGAYKISVAAP
jgi:hypothetical protein